jgi:hypothetical protein
MSRKGLPLRSPVGLSLIGGGSYAAGSSGFPDSSGVRAGVKLQPVFEDQLGVDGVVSVAYESRGFNLVPAVSVELLLARRIGDTLLLLLNLGYGAGLREAERSGRLRAAILTPVVAKLRLGLEARGALDLERDEDEPTGEPDHDVIAGAVAKCMFSHRDGGCRAFGAAFSPRERPSGRRGRLHGARRDAVTAKRWRGGTALDTWPTAARR